MRNNRSREPGTGRPERRLCLLIAALLVLLSSIGTVAALTWEVEVVDSAARQLAGWGLSLALDHADRPHMSYRGGPGLMYSWFDGSVWRTETVDMGIGPASGDTSLALDAEDRPHISYHVELTNDLKYAWYDGSVWHTEIIDSVGDVGATNSLALDSDGTPYISYRDDTNGDLKCARFSRFSSRWESVAIDTVGTVGGSSSLAIDPTGHPCISYIDDTNQALKYAAYDGLLWHIQIVDPTVFPINPSTSLELDLTGSPRISYSGMMGGLRYASFNGSAWQIETVDASAAFASLALDDAGLPRISYLGGDQDLKYAAFDGSAWRIETVDTAGEVGWCTSLAVDGASCPCIGYLDYTNIVPKYARGYLLYRVPGGADIPTDTEPDRKYEDVNGNDRKDFADIVLYFNQLSWIAANEPITAFDYNGNGRIDFADVVWLFNNL